MIDNNLYFKILKKVIDYFKICLYTSLNKPIKPTYINWKITNKCNSRCLFCNIWKIYRENPELVKNELKFDEIKDIFSRNLKYFKNVTGIQITGGEPFLRSDLTEIIETIHNLIPNCNFWFATNGLLPKRVKSILEAICSSCNCKIGVGVSLDGSRDIHDLLRGIKGAYDKAIKTIEYLVDLKADYSNLIIACSYTLTPINFQEVDHIINICHNYNINLTFRPVNISPIYYKNIEIKKWIESELNKKLNKNNKNSNSIDSSLKEIESFLMKSKKSFYEKILDLCFLKGCKDYIENPSNRRLSCYAGFTSFFLDPYGNVYPCIALEKRLGNLREQEFKDIWYSKEAFKARRMVKKLQCPKCWVECETYRDIQLNPFNLMKFTLKYLLLRPKLGG